MKLKYAAQLILLIFIAVIGIGACTSQHSDSVPPTSSIEAAYPEGDGEPMEQDLYIDQGYPAGEDDYDIDAFYPQSVEVPLPGENTGVVTGKLISADNQEPYLAPVLYLGKYQNPEQEAEGLPKAFSISTETDPQAVQSQDGNFVFSNVDPGEYRLFIWTPMNFLIVDDAMTHENIVVQVDIGEVTDLGIIVIP